MAVYAVSPGASNDTKVARNAGPLLKYLMIPIVNLIPGMNQTPETAARRYLQASEFGTDVSGQFFAMGGRQGRRGAGGRRARPDRQDIGSRSRAFAPLHRQPDHRPDHGRAARQGDRAGRHRCRAYPAVDPRRPQNPYKLPRRSGPEKRADDLAGDHRLCRDRPAARRWCELRSTFRHFRMDRIIAAEFLDLRHGRRPADLKAQWTRHFQAERGISLF